MPWRAAMRPTAGGRVHEPALGGHVGDRDEPGARADGALERGHVELPGGVVVHHVDLHARAPLHLEEREVVGRVLGPRGDDAVSGAEGDRVEGHVPGAGRVLHERDLVGAGADQRGDGVVDVRDPVLRLRGGLVAADRRLALQVADHRVEHRARGQGGARVVEVQDAGDARACRRGAAARRASSRADLEHRRLAAQGGQDHRMDRGLAQEAPAGLARRRPVRRRRPPC